jgi:hypothetical protein
MPVADKEPLDGLEDTGGLEMAEDLNGARSDSGTLVLEEEEERRQDRPISSPRKLHLAATRSNMLSDSSQASSVSVVA